MSMMYREAPGMTLAQIGASSSRFRELLGLDEPFLPVIQVLEKMHVVFGEDASFEVAEAAHMGTNHALADPDAKTIWIREDVYEGLHSHSGRDRMTVMHEMAHLILHPGMAFARRMSLRPPDPWRDPEWQAKAWAGAVMMPHKYGNRILQMRADIVAREFGVSVAAAETRQKQLLRLLSRVS